MSLVISHGCDASISLMQLLSILLDTARVIYAALSTFLVINAEDSSFPAQQHRRSII